MGSINKIKLSMSEILLVHELKSIAILSIFRTFEFFNNSLMYVEHTVIIIVTHKLNCTVLEACQQHKINILYHSTTEKKNFRSKGRENNLKIIIYYID